ncbi:MAG: ATP-binding protein [Vampirovibrionales bacterium]|jgi:predicted HTH transcriptional regulator|nr:ATP-binding protein [Vampirovibrionales bacterium]
MIAYETLIDMIQKNPESEWIEYKQKNTDKEKIGENISALVNSACLQKQPVAFIVWGVEDETRTIVGTNFNPKTEKEGNEPLENWLHKLLQPKIQFEFQEFEHQNKKLVVLEIQVQLHQPLSFKTTRYIRIGSTTKNLKEFPAKEALRRYRESRLFLVK